jgi:hypothetical protein
MRLFMKIFSDVRILLNTLYSYGVKSSLKFFKNQKTKKQLNEFIKKYSVIYGLRLIVNPSVLDQSFLIELDLISFNDKMNPIVIYTLPPYESPTFVDQHKKFLDAYKKGQWKIARFYITGLPNNKSYGLRDLAWRGRLHKYYDLMLSRIEGEAPNDWDGVYRLF